jgi:hypothetical protein
MLGRQHHVGGAVDRVRAGGEDAQRLDLVVLDREDQVAPVRAPDPVALHGDDPVGPVCEFFQVVQQLVGVAGDPEGPVGHLALKYGVAAALATPVDHLLVGQHGLTARAPVDQALAVVDQILLVHLQEKPLVPAVVLRLAGGDLAIPVQGQPQHLHLPPDALDVVQRAGARVNLVADGRVLRRQAQGVPAHGVEHVAALHAVKTGQQIPDHIYAHMAHVQVARRIGKHLQDVEFLLLRINFRPEETFFLPGLLPLGLDQLGVVLVLHDSLINMLP